MHNQFITPLAGVLQVLYCLCSRINKYLPIQLLYNQIWKKEGMTICEDIEPADQEFCRFFEK